MVKKSKSSHQKPPNLKQRQAQQIADLERAMEQMNKKKDAKKLSLASSKSKNDGKCESTESSKNTSSDSSIVASSSIPRGLNNVGNTCFFNSTLQAVGSVECFRSLLAHEEEQADSDTNEGDIDFYRGGKCTEALISVLFNLSKVGHTSGSLKDAVNPSNLLTVIQGAYPQYKGRRQQDAHELYVSLMNMLDEERKETIKSTKESIEAANPPPPPNDADDTDTAMTIEDNATTKKKGKLPLKPKKVHKQLTEEEVEELKSHLKELMASRPLSSPFEHELVSSVVCAVCGTRSCRVESQYVVSLAIPGSEAMAKYVPPPPVTRRGKAANKGKTQVGGGITVQTDDDILPPHQPAAESSSTKNDPSKGNDSAGSKDGKEGEEGHVVEGGEPVDVNVNVDDRDKEEGKEEKKRDEEWLESLVTGIDSITVSDNNKNDDINVKDDTDDTATAQERNANEKEDEGKTEEAVSTIAHIEESEPSKGKLDIIEPPLPPPHDPSSPVTLLTCLDHFTKSEQMLVSNGEGFVCPQCTEKQGGGKTDASKRLTLASLPRVCVVHLKRLLLGGKWSNFIPFERTLDLSKCISKKIENGASSEIQSTAEMTVQDEASVEDNETTCANTSTNSNDGAASGPRPGIPVNPLYTLTAVVVHSGGSTGGHYICYIHKPGGWFYCSDASVRRATEQEVMNCQAYMLFYESQIEQKQN